MAIITLDKVSKYYTKRPALGTTTFVINKGDFFGIAGPKKSGKSTIVNLIMDFIRTTSGTVTVMGQLIYKVRDDVEAREENENERNPCGNFPYHSAR